MTRATILALAIIGAILVALFTAYRQPIQPTVDIYANLNARLITTNQQLTDNLHACSLDFEACVASREMCLDNLNKPNPSHREEKERGS
jgi:hypothetical protein